MRVAIVHYHLRPGGVARVIRHAVGALVREGVETVVLTGEPPGDDWDAAGLPTRVEIVGALGYRGDGPRSFSSATLISAARHAFGADPDLWHLHNHSLGKNLFLPSAVRELAAKRCPLLLQIHDFAEDGRPENYALLQRIADWGLRIDETLYPVAPHVHYACLNNRDRRFLLNAGVPACNLHLLPNAVALAERGDAGESPSPRSDIRNLKSVIYPTRAIRRKNLGEFLLWAAAHGNARFAVTLAPENPTARTIYERWAAFAAELRLPVEFEIGRRWEGTFADLLRSADAVATTSVAEGFGLAFLEPWVVGRPLVGRNLPEITDLFSDCGVKLSGLYDRLDVPVEWIGADELRAAIRIGLARTWSAYGRRPQCGDAERAYASFVREDRVDFGRLDERLQEKVIRRLIEKPTRRECLLPARLRMAGDVPENAAAVRREFSLEGYGQCLRQAYEDVLRAGGGPVSTIPSARVLDCFLDPARFNLLRT